MSALPPGLVEKLRTAYGLEVRSAAPLLGGYDVYAESGRVETDRGALVIRASRAVSPLTAGWLCDVMRRAADGGVPSCPLMTAADGSTAFSTGGACVTVRPFVDGTSLDRDHPSQLDVWHEAFTNGGSERLAHGIVHGDFWAGNIVWSGGRVAAVIDWSEARVDVLARELAWATWEFGHDETSRELDAGRARTFLAGYRDVVGPWEPGLVDVFLPLMRVELRRNARYSLIDDGDAAYGTALQRAFATLRHQSAARLLDI